MSKKPHYKFSPNKFKSFSDIPQGAVTSPEAHPANNLAVRGQVPLGQSGEQKMGLMDSALNQSHPDIPGGGNTGQ